MTGPNKEKRKFRFSVADDGTFSYYPNEDWRYNRHDDIEFSTDSGPFTIGFEPKSSPVIDGFNPLGGPLTAEEAKGGTWVAKTSVHDGLSDAKRDAIWNANKPENGDGFIAKYFYHIKGQKPEGGKFEDKKKNGVYYC